jgi:hypothetical protein
MSRAIIGGVVAVVIAGLTATAYFVTTANLEDKIRKDVHVRVAKAQELLIQNASLEGLGLLKRAEALARDPEYVRALRAGTLQDQSDIADLAFRRFRSELGDAESKPDIMALTDKTGRIVALLDVPRPLPESWLQGGKPKYKAISLALENQIVTSEVWDYEGRQLMKAGVAPIVDPALNELLGTLVVAYAMTAREAQRQNDLLGADVAYFHKDKVYATSFRRQGQEENTEKQAALTRPLIDEGLGKSALQSGIADKVVPVEISGEVFLTTAGRLPRFSNKPLPPDYEPSTAGAMVMMSLSDAMQPVGSVRLAILLLGLGALMISLVAISLTAKRILGPLDEIELGINDIINGNIERTFRPVGSDLDGLANSLNVMLARLLGRPEPGEEEFDEDGNIVQPEGGALNVDSETLPAKDAEVLALAQEPEPDYYKRVYGEYISARKQLGDNVQNVSYESFVTKVRLNEANLKKKYECRAVRFKIVVKDGRVTLKPVPIV